MKKMLMTCIIISMVFCNLTFTAYGEGSTLTLRVDQSHILLGNTVTVELVAENIENVAGTEIFLNYDPTRLKPLSKTIHYPQKDYLDLQELTPQFKDTQGTVGVVFGLKKDRELLQGESVVIATVVFRSIGMGQGWIAVDPESRLVEEHITAQGMDYQYHNPHIGGAILITIGKKGSISGTIALSDGKNPQGTAIVLLEGETEIAYTTPGMDGAFSLFNIPDGVYSLRCHKPGYEIYEEKVTIIHEQDVTLEITLKRIKEDVDRNGAIELEDVVYMAQRYGLSMGQEGWSDDADLNGDGKIDLLDILFVGRKLE